MDFRRADFGLFRRMIESPLGSSPEGQRGPGRLNILQEGNLQGTRIGCPHVLKDELVGKRLGWLNREIWLELREEKSIYHIWKKGQEDYENVGRLCRKKVRRAKAQLEINLFTAVRGKWTIFCVL